MPITILLVLLAVAGIGRVVLLEAHFGHVDDLGVALSIVRTQAEPNDTAHLIAQIEAKERMGRATARTAALRALLARPAVRYAINAAAPLYPFVAVPMEWTYPPLPFLATPLLIGPDQPYAMVKLWGRLPSLVFALAAIAVAASAANAATGSMAGAIVAASVLGFSREFTVMSVQMHSYAATVFAAAGLLWLAIRDGAAPRADRRFLLSRGAILALVGYISYQAILLVPGYIVVLATIWLRGGEPARRAQGFGPAGRLVTILRVPVLLGLVFAVAILPAWVFRLRTIPAVNWNAGVHGQFLFHPATVGEAAIHLPGFLVTNGWLTLCAIVAPVAPDSLVGGIFAAIIGILAMLGFGSAVRIALRAPAKNEGQQGLSALAVYTAATLAVFLLFVATGRLTLSPTRHLLVLLPLIAILAGVGLEQLLVSAGAAVRLVGATILAAGLATAAGAALPGLVRERSDPFSEARIVGLVRTTKPDLVMGYDWTVQPMLMPSVRQLVPVALADPLGDMRPLGGTRPMRILMLSHRGPFNEVACATLLARLARPAAAPGQCLARTSRQVLVNGPIAAPEVEASARTQGGGNGFFATLVRLPGVRFQRQ
ncbi:hypothetical protein [Sphingomonas sp. MA1305]|uniref:hypothetical protein n=1 Tax=Sphingomonas sp. MA1305 TaxID=2479204 RepID=UPI0018DFFD48|nr:hypothetical protein [Sphingomonas sp. MA1305]